ncbi:MAG: hypothetical protein TECD_00067 [Hyphomicrobiaceae bacterium hypho_1]
MKYIHTFTKYLIIRFLFGILLSHCLFLTWNSFAKAQRVSNGIVVFSALDKITARIKNLEIPINKTVNFGSLKITPRVCYSSPPEARPRTSTFVQVDEVLLNGSEKRIFSGWMFAESPALNAVEHPVFDVWLTRCSKPNIKVEYPKDKQRKMGPTLPSPTYFNRQFLR